MADSLLTETRLREALGARPFCFYPQSGSTNDLARQWALEGASAGSVIITEEQVAGRGRFGRTWTAPAGTALLFSVIVRPRIRPERLTRLTMVGAVAVGEALNILAPDQVQLKWPNDVLLVGRKVAGILPEAIWLGSDLVAIVVGIGLNVSVEFNGTPLADRAISIETVTAMPINRAVLLDTILHRVDHWSARAEETALFDTWRGWLETLGRRVVATLPDGQITGEAMAVDDDGALLIRTDNGAECRVVAGEVTLSESRGG